MKNSIHFGLVAAVLCVFSTSANALIPVASVPEPSSLGLLGLALALMGFMGRKK